jgi:hypothetical protein
LYKSLFIMILLVLMVSCSAQVLSSSVNPTVNGPTGLVRMPTADSLGYKEFNLFCHYGVDSTVNKGVFRYGANIGTFKSLELGIIGKTDPITNQMQDGVYVNMKYSLIDEDEMYPLKMALGLENMTSRNNTDVYLVATKHFPAGFNLSFGALFDFPNSNRMRTMGMIGGEFYLSGNTIAIPMDVQIGETITQFNLGLRWFINSNISFAVNSLNVINDSTKPNLDNPTTYFGISWENPF